MKLLTAGCGISQISFPHWPTWVKYPTLTHELEHVNIGGPASGNEFLAHNIIKNIKDIDCAIIMGLLPKNRFVYRIPNIQMKLKHTTQETFY